MEIHQSACRHGIDDDDIWHAVDHALVVDVESRDAARRILFLGPDRAGNLLEVMALEFDDEQLVVIHAMRMRRKYENLLH